LQVTKDTLTEVLPHLPHEIKDNPKMPELIHRCVIHDMPKSVEHGNEDQVQEEFVKLYFSHTPLSVENFMIDKVLLYTDCPEVFILV
jgi:ssDNA-specific exonuclease RecJ